MPKIHVLLKKEELDQQRLPGKVVIVLDILFATSSIVTALAHGASSVIPARDGSAALAKAQQHRHESCMLSGELNAETLPGFLHPTPLALLNASLEGKTLIYATTNGTVAVDKARDAEHVYIGALLNATAVVERVLRDHHDDTILLVCSGSADNFNLEDFYGAGCLVALFQKRAPGCELTDAALAASLLARPHEAAVCLAAGRVGRMMLERGLQHELEFAAQLDRYRLVPKLQAGRLIL